jgi:hypothetical protein
MEQAAAEARRAKTQSLQRNELKMKEEAAERMAKQLIEEEEREKGKKKMKPA